MKRLLRLGMTVLLLLSLTAATVLAAETATITVNVTNTPVRGDVRLEKTGLQLVRFEDEQDACGNTVMRPVFQNGYLAGAVFELRAAEDIVGKEGSVFYRKDELIETLTSSKTGSVKSKVLPLGKYTLTEISAPDGYVFDTTPHPFTLAAVDKQTAIVEVKVSASNTYLPVRVTLRKQKEDLLLTQTQEGMIHQTVEVYSGEGFVFGLYTGEIITYGDSQKLPANTLVATGTTDAQGNLTLSGLYPHGNYYIRELSVPEGAGEGSSVVRPNWMPPPMTAAPMAAKSIFSRSVIVSALHQCRGVLACCVNVAHIPSEYAGSAPEGVTFKNSMPESHGCSLSRRTRRRKLSGGPERVPSRRMRFFSTTVSAAGTKWELCIPDRLTISCSEVTMSGRVSGVGRVLVAPRRRRVSSRRALSPSMSG